MRIDCARSLSKIRNHAHAHSNTLYFIGFYFTSNLKKIIIFTGGYGYNHRVFVKIIQDGYFKKCFKQRNIGYLIKKSLRRIMRLTHAVSFSIFT